jgi:hypothetical protein
MSMEIKSTARHSDQYEITRASERKALVDTMAEMGGQTERLDQEEEDVRCPLIHPRRPTGMAWPQLQ